MITVILYPPKYLLPSTIFIVVRWQHVSWSCCSCACRPGLATLQCHRSGRSFSWTIQSFCSLPLPVRCVVWIRDVTCKFKGVGKLSRERRHLSADLFRVTDGLGVDYKILYRPAGVMYKCKRSRL